MDRGEGAYGSPDPQIPTFRMGAAPDAIVMALGAYLPEGLLFSDKTDEEVGEGVENSPAYVSDRPVLGEHMALYLAFHTLWPQIEGSLRKYSIKGFKRKD